MHPKCYVKNNTAPKQLEKFYRTKKSRNILRHILPHQKFRKNSRQILLHQKFQHTSTAPKILENIYVKKSKSKTSTIQRQKIHVKL